MDIVGSAASVAQLLSQVISLWQQISQARQAMRRVPKAIQDLEAQLSNLAGTAREIEQRPELQTPGIGDQLVVIYSIGAELKQILEDMEALRRKSAFMQGLHALSQRQPEESALKNVLDRLQMAQTELGIRIDVAHIRITSGVVKGMERIEQGVHTVINEKDEDSDTPRRFILDRNVAKDASDQRNGISVSEISAMSTSARISDNEALGHSRQSNLILLGPVPTHLLKGFSD